MMEYSANEGVSSPPGVYGSKYTLFSMNISGTKAKTFASSPYTSSQYLYSGTHHVYRRTPTSSEALIHNPFLSGTIEEIPRMTP